MACTRDSLVRWVNTFASPAQPEVESLSQLKDGVAIAHILSQVKPASFAAIGAEASPAERCQTLSTFDFYWQEADIDVEAFTGGDEVEIERVATMALCSAVQSENKADFIRVITFLENDVQLTLMSLISAQIPCSPSVASPRAFNSGRRGGAVHTPNHAASPALSRLSRVNTAGGYTPSPRKAQALEASRFELQHVRADLEEMQVLYEEAMAELSDRTKQVEEHRSQSAGLQKKLQDLQTLQDEVEDLRVLKGKYERMEREISKYKESLSESRAKTEQYETAVEEQSSLKKKLDILTMTNDSLEKRIKEYRKNMAEQEMGLNELEATLAHKASEVVTALTANEGLEDQNQQLKAQLRDLKDRVSELEQELRTSRDGDHKAGLRLEMKSKKLHIENTQLRQEVQELRAAGSGVDLLQDRLKDRSELCDRLKEKALTKEKEYFDLHAKYKTLEHSLKRQHSNASDVVTQANVKLQQLLRENEVLKADNRRVIATQGLAEANTGELDVGARSSAAASASAQAPKKQTYYGAAPPWGAPAAKEEADWAKMTDEQRLRELKTRNKRQLPHLQSSYALETMMLPEEKETCTPPPSATARPKAVVMEFSPVTSKPAQRKPAPAAAAKKPAPAKKGFAFEITMSPQQGKGKGGPREPLKGRTNTNTATTTSTTSTA